MSSLGKLCHKKSSSPLAYKKDEGSLIFKVEPGDWTMISFAWGSEGKDLDICGYWSGASSLQMGYGHNTSKAEQVQDSYHILYSGDITSSDSSEWCKVKMSPWSKGERTFKVHFNYFGFDEEDYPLNTCTVIASQQGGETLIKRNVPCATSKGRAANTSDPCVTIAFDETGNLISLT